MPFNTAAEGILIEIEITGHNLDSLDVFVLVFDCSFGKDPLFGRGLRICFAFVTHRVKWCISI